MTSDGDTANAPIAISSSQVGTIAALGMRPGRAQWHVTQIDQLRVSPRLWEIQQAGRALAQTIDARETKIIALREDVESGNYRIKTEQVAEKLMKDHLLASFAS